MNNIKELLGKTITQIVMTDDSLTFTTNDETYRMDHERDCCEVVWLDDVAGDMSDLIESTILEAEELTEIGELYTWTFYKLGTKKGFVTLTWRGESNGYYSEAVDFKKL